MAGDAETGVSIMRLTEGLDSGPVCLAAPRADRARGRLRRAGGAPGARRGRPARARPRRDRPRSPSRTRPGSPTRRRSALPIAAWTLHAPGGRARARRARAASPHRRPLRRTRRAPRTRRPGRRPGAGRPRRVTASACSSARPRARSSCWSSNRRAASPWRPPTTSAATVCRDEPRLRGKGSHERALGPLCGAQLRSRLGRLPQSWGLSVPSPARTAAFTVVRRVFEEGAYTDRALHRRGARRARAPARHARSPTAPCSGAGTLDHVIADLAGRPAEQARPAGAGGAAARALPARLDRRGRRPRGGRRVRGARQARRARAWLVNAVLRRAARGARRLLAALTDDTPGGGRAQALAPGVDRASCGGTRSGRRRRARCSRPTTSPRRSRARQHARRPAELAAARRRRRPTRRALVLRLVDALGSPAQRRARSRRSRARRCSSRRGRSRSRASGSSTCARRRAAKATHLAALMGDRGRGRRRRAQRAARRRSAAERGAHARGQRHRRARATPGSRAGGFDRVLVDPPCTGLGTLRSPAPTLRWRTRPSVDELGAHPARDPRRGRARASARAACSSTRRARSRRRRTRTRSPRSWRAARLRRRRPAFRVAALGASARARPRSRPCRTGTAPTASSSRACGARR